MLNDEADEPRLEGLPVYDGDGDEDHEELAIAAARLSGDLLSAAHTEKGWKRLMAAITPEGYDEFGAEQTLLTAFMQWRARSIGVEGPDAVIRPLGRESIYVQAVAMRAVRLMSDAKLTEEAQALLAKPNCDPEALLALTVVAGERDLPVRRDLASKVGEFAREARTVIAAQAEREKAGSDAGEGNG